MRARDRDALRAGEARCRNLIDRNADGLIVVRRSGVIALVNPAAEALLGRRTAELVGTLFGVPLVPGEAEEVDILRGGRPGGVAEMRVTEIDWEGEPAYLATLRDVTERKRSAEGLRLLAEASSVLADSLDLPAGMAGLARLVAGPWADWCVVDLLAEEGGVRRVAAAHARPGREGLVRSLLGTYSLRPGDREGLPAVLRGGKAQAHARVPAGVFEGLGLGDRGRRVVAELGCVSALIVPLAAHGRTAGALTLAWAESGRHYGPEDLPLFEALAHRAALAADNARLYAEARLAVRRRDELLALLGHELRNPLASVLNAAEILRQCGGSDPAAVRAREVVERQGEVMRRLLDDLLDLSRLTRGRVELRKARLDLRSAVAEAAEASRPLLEGRGHELTLELPDKPLAVEADPDRLQQVLGNLLRNAAKYTPEGGRVRVSAGRQGGEAVVRVRDTGVGLAPEMLEAVFEPFVQAETSPGRAQGGLGIGLALVKRLVELHGGSVRAHSDGPGKGSEFVVRLPAAEPVAAPAGGAPAGDGGHCRVVLVEDNADVREMMGELLVLMGHEVESAPDGVRGLELVLGGGADVALVDVGLPGLDGHELARRARAAGGEGLPYLVALTGYGQAEDRRKALAAGFDEHLVKPADLGRLRGVLRAARERRGKKEGGTRRGAAPSPVGKRGG